MSRAWSRVSPVVRRKSFFLQIVADALAWYVGMFAATLMRYDFNLHPIGVHSSVLTDVLTISAIAIVVHAVVGGAVGLYVGRWAFGSFEEVLALTKSVGITTAIVALVNRYPAHHPIPVSASMAGGVGALVLMCGTRYTWRLISERRLRPSEDHAQRVVVLGAGEGGVQLLTTMLRTPNGSHLPVALLDDDPTKQNLRIRGVPVLGTREQLAEVAASRSATGVVVAIPSASARLIREVSAEAEACGLSVMVLPPVSELLGSQVGLGDLRPITEADLLGRHEIDTDVEGIADYLTGHRVLVTGAGGSIGSELCRQIYRFAPSELIMLDRDESALHAVQLSIEGKALLDSPNLVVADIRDLNRINDIFETMQPEVVFHAAALKHLPLLEMHPSEAVKTNIWGTDNLLQAAANAGVDRFVNISTDKAADPCSVLGYSKRVAERITADVAERTRGTYLSVRFGNVLGSRGSVLTAFRSQIAAGGPVTVTHPDVTRYFMTVEEAVQLVIQAGAVGSDGQALVLDMGDPVRIDDVARRLVEQADRPIDIIYTGMRPGEKLHEVLLGEHEEDERPTHPLISHVHVPPLDPALTAKIDIEGGNQAIIAGLRSLCDEHPDRYSVSFDD